MAGDSAQNSPADDGTKRITLDDGDRATQIEKRLDALERLAPNWNGYNAPRINPDIIAAARSFAAQFGSEILELPAVVPMSRGRLQFEWNHGDRSLELEFQDPATVHYLKCDDAMGIEDENIVPISDGETLTGLLRWFFGGPDE